MGEHANIFSCFQRYIYHNKGCLQLVHISRGVSVHVYACVWQCVLISVLLSETWIKPWPLRCYSNIDESLASSQCLQTCNRRQYCMTTECVNIYDMRGIFMRELRFKVWYINGIEMRWKMLWTKLLNQTRLCVILIKTRVLHYMYLHQGPVLIMMTSLDGNIFRVTGDLCGEFTGRRWIPRTKASDAELWGFLWSASE